MNIAQNWHPLNLVPTPTTPSKIFQSYLCMNPQRRSGGASSNPLEFTPISFSDVGGEETTTDDLGFSRIASASGGNNDKRTSPLVPSSLPGSSGGPRAGSSGKKRPPPTSLELWKDSKRIQQAPDAASLVQQMESMPLFVQSDDDTTTAASVRRSQRQEDGEEMAGAQSSQSAAAGTSRGSHGDSHTDRWSERIQELTDFKSQTGHCNVPHGHENKGLARWVKRQRHQYKMMKEGLPCTMTQKRIDSLEALGFIWDVHGDVWDGKLSELKRFRETHRHCDVPCNFPENQQLAVWIKCQRRQYKLFKEGSPSSMTQERIQQLESLGFRWELRRYGKRK